jgi:VPS16-like protein
MADLSVSACVWAALIISYIALQALCGRLPNPHYPTPTTPAITRDESKVLLMDQSTMTRDVYIYSSAGRKLASIPWSRGRLVKLGWTSDEKLVLSSHWPNNYNNAMRLSSLCFMCQNYLQRCAFMLEPALQVCVLDDGAIALYSIHGEWINQFSIGGECAEYGVKDAFIWSTGVVVLTGNYQFFAVTNLEEPRPKRLADSGLLSAPTAWAVIEPRFSLSKTVEVHHAYTVLMSPSVAVLPYVSPPWIVRLPHLLMLAHGYYCHRLALPRRCSLRWSLGRWW